MSTKSMTTQEQLESFYQFATARLGQAGAKATLDDLYCAWQFANRTPEEYAADVAAIQEALDELEAGVEPIPFEQFVNEFRERNGIRRDR